LRCRVCILYPVQFSITQNEVGIVFQPEEGSDTLHTLLNLFPKNNLAVFIDIIGQQNIDITEMTGKEQLFKEIIDRHPAAALIMRIYILVPLRVIQLLNIGIYNFIIVIMFAIINRRLLNLEIDLALWRDIPDNHAGVALRAFLRDG